MLKINNIQHQADDSSREMDAIRKNQRKVLTVKNILTDKARLWCPH